MLTRRKHKYMKKYSRQIKNEQKQQKNKMKLRKFMFVALYLVVFIFSGAGIYAYVKLDTVAFDKDEDFGISSSEVTESDESDEEDDQDDFVLTDEVFNILILGVDEEDYDSGRSDVMMVATVDTSERNLKLTSLMRDTLVHIPTSNTYQKLNHAYMEGGAIETVRAVNRNLDLDIENFVIVNFDAVAQMVDTLGGYPVTVDEGEAYDMGISTGPHHLTGKEAVRYVRVRKNSGGDAGRNQRQRDLIVYMLKETKNMNKFELLKLINQMLPLVKTTYSLSDIHELMELYLAISNNLEFEQFSFPSEYKGGKLNDGLWYATPVTLKDNVIELHNNLYNNENYIPNSVIDEISESISARTGLY